MKLYHGTPYKFNFLRKGSWLASSKEQAATYLMLKNAQLGKIDLLEGYILEITVNDDVKTSDKFEYIETFEYFISNYSIKVSSENFLVFRDILPNLKGRFSSIKSATHVMSLSDILKKKSNFLPE